jgi:hypothetical protein
MKDIFRGIAEISTIVPSVHPLEAGSLPVLSEWKTAGSKKYNTAGIKYQAIPYLIAMKGVATQATENLSTDEIKI